MDANLKEKVEAIIGPISDVFFLEDQGCTSKVYKIITDRSSFILKSAFQEKYIDWLKQEAGVLDKLNRNSSIKVPTYYGYFEQKSSSHLLMSLESGTTLTTALKKADSQLEKTSLIRSFGEFLSQLHDLTIIESLHHQGVWLDRQLEKAESYVLNRQTDGSRELLELIKSNKPKAVSQTMIHGDCTTDNVLVVDGEVRVFIDVSGMTVGDPRYDIALAIRSFNEEEIEAFYDGYTTTRISDEEFYYFNDGLYEFF